MSIMLALRCVAPVFALLGAITVWALAGPMAAGLTLVVFLLGVITSELNHMRWSRVEEAVPEALEGEPPHVAPSAPVLSLVAAAPQPLPIAPRRSFRCTCQGLAIGSGRSLTGLAERSRRHAARPARRRPEPTPAPAPTRPAEVQTLKFRAAYEARLTA